MAFEALFNGMQAFSKGMQDYSVQKAIGAASDQMQQLKANDMNEQQRSAALSQLGNQLTLQMAATGAPVSQIQTAVGAIKPAMPSNASEAFLQGQLTGNEFMQKTAQAAQGFEEAPKLGQIKAQGAEEYRKEQLKQTGDTFRENMKMQMLLKKQDNTLQSHEVGIVDHAQKEFNTLTKDLFKAQDQADTAKKLVDSQNPLSYSQLKVILPRLAGDVGRISDQERELIVTNPSIVQSAKKFADLKTFGALPESDKENIRQVINFYASGKDSAINKTANRIATQKAALLGRDPADMLKRIYPAGVTDTTSSPPGTTTTGGVRFDINNHVVPPGG